MSNKFNLYLSVFLFFSVQMFSANQAFAKKNKKHQAAVTAAKVNHAVEPVTSLESKNKSGMAVVTSEKLVESLRSKIKPLVQNSGLSESQMSLYVALAGNDSPQEILNVQGKKKIIPASVTKLVTAGTVIHHFPPGFKFKTTLLSNAKIENGVLKGDLYLKGGGDPSFVSETMWYLVNVFTRQQIKSIEGKIIVDDSLFDRQRFDSSRQKERVDRAYDAPTGAMSFNWNSINIFVRPGLKSGEAAKVFADPESDYIRVKNNVKTTGEGGKTSVAADRDEDAVGGGDMVQVSGHIASDSKEIAIYKNVTQPDMWSGANLKFFLRQRGIQVQGDVVAGVSPDNAKVLAEAESKPVEAILADMNKFSNNYVAEMLTKNLGTLVEKPGSISKGMTLLNQYMKSLSIPDDQYELYNPSGLTRQNKLSAFALWNVLNDIKQTFKYQPEFISSLPIAGIDGTLKNRMRNTAGERWIRAKTGYLTGVVALAGFAGRTDGTIVPFVFIYNGSTDESKVRLIFDKFATSLVQD